MIAELFRRILYSAWVQLGRRATGIQVYYKVQYAHDYGLSARWYALRTLRLMIDGHRCTQRINLRRCDMTTTLQGHHTSYQFKGAPGVSIMTLLLVANLLVSLMGVLV